ncbi:MAG: glycosyltransferase family 2 protein [Candidatus Velthaea sp.]
MNTNELTVVVLTRNEAARLPAALARVPAGAHVFVLDAESDDATAAVAGGLGATVERRSWSGFVDARRYALARVTTRWTLMLDADEALDAELCAAIERAPEDVDAYRLRRITALCGKPIRTAGWSNEKLIRLFRSDRVRLSAHSVGGGADLHERWVTEGTIGELPGAIMHDSYPTLASYREKFARYTTIEADAVRGSLFALIRGMLLGAARFPWSILRYGGWRDGWRGMLVAAYSAAYPVVVQWKALRAR